MARKKENPTPRHATAEEQNVMGLRSAVVEQPVTETLENNYIRDERHRLARHPGDRRL